MNKFVRRRAVVVTVTAVITAGGLAAVTPIAASAATTCKAGTSLGMMGALTGPNRQFGIAITRGAALAVTRHNKAHPGCTVHLVRADSQGDPAKAPAAAKKLQGNRNVLAVVGPTFSGESLATGASFARSKLVTLTPSATNPEITAHRWATFVRGTPNDDTLGILAARFLKATLKRKHVCVVSDGSAYGEVSGGAVAHYLGRNRACTVTLNYSRPDYAAATRTVIAKHADSVFFAGYDTEAAPMVRRLRGAKFRGAFVGSDGTNSALFAKRAGSAGTGAYVVAGPAPKTISKNLAALYRKTYGSTIPSYAAEAFDVANVELAGIDHGKTTRAAMLTWVRHYDAKGITQTFHFTARGELAKSNAWVYVVRKGALVFARRVS